MTFVILNRGRPLYLYSMLEINQATKNQYRLIYKMWHWIGSHLSDVFYDLNGITQKKL
jgi:hypothetical protein